METRDADQIMTVAEVAQYLRLGESTVYRLVQEGEIPGVKVGRSWRFKKGLIDVWLEGEGNITENRLEQETRV